MIKKLIHKPKGGWKPQTWYLVEASFSPDNIIHRTLFFTGFIRNGIPDSCNYFPDDEDHLTYSDAFYLNPVRIVARENDFAFPVMATLRMIHNAKAQKKDDDGATCKNNKM